MLRKLILRPGVNRQVTQTLADASYWDSSRVRWRMGLPEKLGGWVNWLSGSFLGAARSLFAWNQLNGSQNLAVGTHTNLYLVQSGVVYDITPLKGTIATVGNGIVTTAGSTEVRISTAAAHGASVGDTVTFDTIAGQVRTPASISVGGLVLTGDYIVTRTSSATDLYINASSAAVSSSSVAASQTVTFFLAIGLADATAVGGYGAGGYGGVQPDGTSTGYGSLVTAAAIFKPPRIWSLDNWGEQLVAVPTQGALHYLAPAASGAIDSRAAVVLNTITPEHGPPLQIGFAFVALPERHLILCGCSDLNQQTNFDPMLLRWSDVEDLTEYFATSTNSAGSARLIGGSRLVGALNTQRVTLIWSDTACFSMQFINLPFVYRFDRLGLQCGLIAQRAFAMLADVVYWMSPDGFFRYRGSIPEIMPSTLWDEVYDGLNRAQAAKVFCSTTASHGEVTWWYPSGDSLDPDRYVTYNVIDDCWYGGAMPRTSYIDTGTFSTPLGITRDGKLYRHEVGYDDDASPMMEYLETGMIDLDGGDSMMFMRGMLADFQGPTPDSKMTGAVNMYFKSRKFPNGQTRTRGPYLITADSRNTNVRMRGRQVALRIEGNGTGGFWRMGAPRFDPQPDGTT